MSLIKFLCQVTKARVMRVTITLTSFSLVSSVPVVKWLHFVRHTLRSGFGSPTLVIPLLTT